MKKWGWRTKLGPLRLPHGRHLHFNSVLSSIYCILCHDIWQINIFYSCRLQIFQPFRMCFYKQEFGNPFAGCPLNCEQSVGYACSLNQFRISSWFSVTHLMFARVLSRACSRAVVPVPNPMSEFSILNFSSFTHTKPFTHIGSILITVAVQRNTNNWHTSHV